MSRGLLTFFGNPATDKVYRPLSPDGTVLSQLPPQTDDDVEKQLAALKKEAQEKEETQEKERKRRKEELTKTLELDPTIHLMGCLYISRSAYERLSSSFEGVVLPSLFTKAYGREAMVSGLVTHASAGIGSFILSNLMYAAPEVALIAGTVRFAYVLIKDLRAGVPLEVALKNAAKDAVKTAIKFFIVYMVWTLAVALGTKLGILAGPLLPLGLVMVGVITSLGFTFANFLVETLPAILAEPKKSWESFKEKLDKLKSCFLPGLMEGTAWTLMDNDAVNISGHIGNAIGTSAGHVIGNVADIVGVSLVVSAMFFVGAVIHSSISRWLNLRKKPKLMEDANKVLKVESGIRALAQTYGQGPKGLRRLANDLDVKDPQLKTAIIQYLQYYVVLKTLEDVMDRKPASAPSSPLLPSKSHSLNASPNATPRLRRAHSWPSLDNPITPSVEDWVEAVPDVSNSPSLFDRDEKARDHLNQVKEVWIEMQDMSKASQAQAKAVKIKEKLELRRSRSFEDLKKFGVFSDDLVGKRKAFVDSDLSRTRFEAMPARFDF